jgi:hypothetical protein
LQGIRVSTEIASGSPARHGPARDGPGASAIAVADTGLAERRHLRQRRDRGLDDG